MAWGMPSPCALLGALTLLSETDLLTMDPKDSGAGTYHAAANLARIFLFAPSILAPFVLIETLSSQSAKALRSALLWTAFLGIVGLGVVLWNRDVTAAVFYARAYEGSTWRSLLPSLVVSRLAIAVSGIGLHFALARNARLPIVFALAAALTQSVVLASSSMGVIERAQVVAATACLTAVGVLVHAFVVRGPVRG